MRLLALLACLSLLPGCNRKKPLVTVEPSKADIAGRYELTHWNFNEEFDSMIREKVASSYIELRADGTMIMHEVPVVPETSDGPFAIQSFHSGEGTYSIIPQGSTAESAFYGLHIDCGDLPDPVYVPRLRGSGDSFTLSYDYFNGDFIQRLAYTRKDSSSAK